MKVGFLSIYNFGSNIGGVENHIYFLSQELVKLGCDVVIFQPIDKKIFTKSEERFNNIKVVYIPVETPIFINYLSKYNSGNIVGFLTAFLNKAKYIFSYKKIASEILKHKCDIIHQHDFISNLFTTKYLNKQGVKCILTNHTGEYLFFQKKLVGRIALRYLLKHYRVIIGPSKELTPIKYNKNSITIYNGVDLNQFYPLEQAEKIKIRKNLNLSEKDFIIFCPRRWAPTKGIIYLVKSIIENNYPSNFKFLFAGSDYDGYMKYSEKINYMINNSNKKNQIIKLGNLNVQEMQKIYNISDIVIIPSLMEAVSLAALEAMATGTPVISTNVGGMPELIKNEFNGLLIKPASSSEIYNAIIKLYKDRKLYDKIVKNSLETARNFSWSSIAKKTFQIYQEVLND